MPIRSSTCKLHRMHRDYSGINIYIHGSKEHASIFNATHGRTAMKRLWTSCYIVKIHSRWLKYDESLLSIPHFQHWLDWALAMQCLTKTIENDIKWWKTLALIKWLPLACVVLSYFALSKIRIHQSYYFKVTSEKKAETTFGKATRQNSRK